MKKKQGKTFNFITSVKGGCGKTTVSIFLAYFLQKYGGSAVVDMDLQGTALEYLFYGSTGQANLLYLEDAIREGKTPDDCMRTLNVQNQDFHVVFASPHAEDKSLYRPSAGTGYTAVAHYHLFRNSLNDFLKKFRYKENICHLVFDMPPNSDPFSDAAMECVLTRKGNIYCKEDKINMFYVQGIDAGNIPLTIDAIVDMLLQREHWNLNRIFVVLNDHINHADTIFSEEMPAIFTQKGAFMNNIFDRIRNANVQESELSKIYFLWLEPQPIFAYCCMTGKGIVGQPEIGIPDKIANFVGYLKNGGIVVDPMADFVSQYGIEKLGFSIKNK